MIGGSAPELSSISGPPTILTGPAVALTPTVVADCTLASSFESNNIPPVVFIVMPPSGAGAGLLPVIAMRPPTLRS